MAKIESPDPFVCNDEVEVDAETSRILKERVESADQGRLVSAEEARRRIREWLSKSSITKMR